MRITNPASARGTEKGRQDRNTGSTAGKASQRFDSRLSVEQKSFSDYDRELEELKALLEEAGTQLERQPTLPNFNKFKELLGTLSKKVTAEAYRLEKFGGTPQNPRYFEIITVIDSEMEKLYNLILSGQKDHMAITAGVIGIKGLVVDLLT